MQRWFGILRSGKWSGWPQVAYRRENYQQRLRVVKVHLAECLNDAAQGPLRLVSLCAGDGRDVIDVLQSNRRRNDVGAWLVELNGQSIADGALHMKASGLEKLVNFIHADATDYLTYQTLVPCDIILLCGVWGHVPVNERALLVRALASFSKPGGSLIWTRGISRGMDRLNEIQSQFANSSWERVRLSFTPNDKWAISTHRYCGPSLELPASGRIFNFRKNAG
jgi:hypothetical protein